VPATDIRPALGLTGKGRAAALLITVRDAWEQLTPDQQAEFSAILERLSAALRREQSCTRRQHACSGRDHARVVRRCDAVVTRRSGERARSPRGMPAEACVSSGIFGARTWRACDDRAP
jgi:hypothetical protein